MNLMKSKYYTAIYCVMSAFIITLIGNLFSLTMLIFLFVGSYFVLLGYANTFGVSVISVLAYFAMVYYPMGYYSALFCTIILALPMTLVGYTLQKTIKDVKSQAPFFVGICLTTAFIFISFKLYAVLTDVSLKELIDILVTKPIQMQQGESELLKGKFLPEPEEMKILIDKIKLMLPSSLFILSTILALINQYIGMGLICKATRTKLKNTPKAFRFFAYPKQFIYLSALTLAIAASFQDSPNGFIAAISINIIAVFIYLLAIQGLAIMVYNLQRDHILIKIVVFTSMLLFASVSVNILAFLGAIDVLADWRGLYRKGK